MPPLLDSLIFCDDIREEKGNKITLAGVYGKHLFFPADAKFPAGIRQLCVYLRFTGIRGGETVRLRVSMNDEVIFEAPESSQVKVPDQPNEYAAISMFLIPFGVQNVGDLKFGFYWGKEDRPFREEVLYVRLAP
jgi:hypothetical protein